MLNRLLPLFLLLLLVGLHVQLWAGRTSVGHVLEMRRLVASQQAANEQAEQANQRLAAEVQDLKDGLELVEEKARQELGMVRQGEMYVHIMPTPGAAATAPAPSTSPTR